MPSRSFCQGLHSLPGDMVGLSDMLRAAALVQSGSDALRLRVTVVGISSRSHLLPVMVRFWP